MIIFIQCAQIAIRQYHDNFPDPSLLWLLFPDSYFCCFRNNTSIRLYSFAKGNLTQKVSGHFQKYISGERRNGRKRRLKIHSNYVIQIRNNALASSQNWDFSVFNPLAKPILTCLASCTSLHLNWLSSISQKFLNFLVFQKITPINMSIFMKIPLFF